jgi:hypothetical protein
MTLNEARRILGWNPMPGGNVRYFPLAMGRVDEKGNDVPPPTAPLPPRQQQVQAARGGRATITPETTRSARGASWPATGFSPARSRSLAKLAGSLRKAIVAAAGRCLRKEAAEAVKAAKKPDGFVGWIDSFYVKHAEMVEENLRPLLESWAAAFPFLSADDLNWPALTARAHVDRSRRELLTAAECKPAELVAAVERVTERWTGERLAEIGAELQPESMALEG